MSAKKKISCKLYIDKLVGQRDSAEIKEAKHVYRHELSSLQQNKLVEELINTRLPELCKAYKNVVSIYTGIGYHTNKKGVKKRKGDIPKVIFLVKRKWKDKRGKQSAEKVPKFLFAYFSVAEKRKLCAIPTDVVCAKEAANVRIEKITHQVDIIASGETERKGFGTITCAVQRSTFPNKTYIMSCRHVFSLSEKSHPNKLKHAKVFSRGNITPFKYAKTTQIKGELVDRLFFSLDSQLAIVKNHSKLRSALKNIQFTDYARSFSDIPQGQPYWIITSRQPVKVKYNNRPSGIEVNYGHPDLKHIIHADMIVSDFINSSNITQDGDSGSPVTSEKKGGILLGMHFARPDTTSAYFIPAWVLFETDNYNKPDEVWNILNADDIQP